MDIVRDETINVNSCIINDHGVDGVVSRRNRAGFRAFDFFEPTAKVKESCYLRELIIDYGRQMVTAKVCSQMRIGFMLVKDLKLAFLTRSMIFAYV